MAKVLGLDVSTTTVGLCFIELDSTSRRLLGAAAVRVSGQDGIYLKGSMLRKAILELTSEHGNPDVVIVEEPLQRFSRGLSSSKTLSTLMRFNGVACYVAQEATGIEPQLVNVNVARREQGILIPKGSKETKQLVLNWVRARTEFCDYDWPKKTLRGGPRRGETIEDEVCYDIADAAVMSLYGCLVHPTNK